MSNICSAASGKKRCLFPRERRLSIFPRIVNFGASFKRASNCGRAACDDEPKLPADTATAAKRSAATRHMAVNSRFDADEKLQKSTPITYGNSAAAALETAVFFLAESSKSYEEFHASLPPVGSRMCHGHGQGSRDSAEIMARTCWWNLRRRSCQWAMDEVLKRLLTATLSAGCCVFFDGRIRSLSFSTPNLVA